MTDVLANVPQGVYRERMADESTRSPKLPGGDLVTAVLNRRLMSLADRGRASGMVGARWADLASSGVVAWPGSSHQIPGQDGRAFLLEHVVRLDSRPEVATRASKRSLQNPDLVFVGTVDGHPALQAADAKFSVETARAKQVSAAVVEGLLTLGEIVTDLLPAPTSSYTLVDGIFLSPDYSLTHLMFQRRYGVVRTTVRVEQVALIPVVPARFFAPLDGAALMPVLAGIDALPVSIDEDLAAGLYYFRLARAAVGCGLDAKAPLLGLRDRVQVDESMVLLETQARAKSARTAYELILEWNVEVDQVRRQREAVDRVAGFPIRGQEVRAFIEEHQARTNSAVPSINQVRRRVGAWYRSGLVDRVGPMEPPIADLDAALARLARAAREISLQAEDETRRVIAELSVAEDVSGDSGSPPVLSP